MKIPRIGCRNSSRKGLQRGIHCVCRIRYGHHFQRSVQIFIMFTLFCMSHCWADHLVMPDLPVRQNHSLFRARRSQAVSSYSYSQHVASPSDGDSGFRVHEQLLHETGLCKCNDHCLRGHLVIDIGQICRCYRGYCRVWPQLLPILQVFQYAYIFFPLRFASVMGAFLQKSS